MKNDAVSVVMVHWNTPDDLLVQGSTLRVQKNIEAIVVDNASKRSKKLRQAFMLLKRKRITVIKNKKNRGFATANNQGAKRSKGNWILFLNPDTHISLQSILSFVKKADEMCLDAVSPVPLSDRYFKPLPTPLSLLVEFSPLQRLIPLDVFKRRTLFGGGLLIRRNVFKKIGEWDEKFFLWFEDSDLTKRLLKEGFRVGWVKVRYKHKGGVSFERISEKKKKRMFFRSMSRYAKKHFNIIGRGVVQFLTLLNNR